MDRIEIKHWSGKVLYTHQPAESSGMTMRHAMEAAVLRGAVLRGAVLRGAVLSDADLSDADLRGADLRGADLRGADLSGAVLSGADLSGAVLSGAVLSGAVLSGAVLSGAVLSGAVLSGTTVYGVKIARAPVSIEGLLWPVLIIDGHIKIGCQLHAIGAWAAFDDAVIAAMDGRDALRFWREHKAAIMLMAAPFAAAPATIAAATN
jgi:uncharacterized protein YjbI with pentapeptide repeats